MKKALHTMISGIVLILPLCFLASCQDLTGPQGEPGADGRDAIVRDTAYAVETALAEKTGDGDEEPWALTVSGVDISDPQAFRYMIATVAAALAEGDIALDLSGCTGKTFAYVDGISDADKSRIVSIILPESLTHLIDGSQGYGAFSGYPNLGRVRAPGLAYIGDHAFNVSSSSTAAYNEALTEADFPEARHVGASAFYYCENLSAIRLPKAEYIGEYAFVGDASFSSLTEVKLPEARSIGDFAFYAWRTIATIYLPEVRSIGKNAFSAPSALLPNEVLTTLELPNVETISDTAFMHYSAIGSINLPRVTSIGESAFFPGTGYPNTALTTLSLPEATSIGNTAFQYYKAIERIILPKVTSIGTNAFSGGVATAGGVSTTFANEALTTVELPSVTSIGNTAFAYCTALSSLKLGPTVPTSPNLSTSANNGIFANTGSEGIIDIQVPSDRETAYADAGWKAVDQGDNTQAATIKFGTNHKKITISTYTE